MPIMFKNEGVIPLAAIKTFGVSVKDDDNAIGFFGTGLKYALAILLRHGCQVRAYIGGQRVDFITAEEDIRGKKFDIVCMLETDGDEENPPQYAELGFTTELGKTWEPWMAFRELHCNTLDEGGTTEWVDEMPPECFAADPKMTVFIIEGPIIPTMWDERHSVMLVTDPIYEGAGVNVHQGNGKHLYYRGIRVMDHHKPAKYDYNIVGKHVDLTEDRTAKYPFQVRYAVTSLVMSSNDADFIRGVICDVKEGYEEELNFIEVGMTATETFLDVVGALRSENVLGVNHTAVEYHREHRSRNMNPSQSVEMTEVEKLQLKRAKRAVMDMGYDLIFPIVVVDYLGQNVLGKAELGHIYLSKRAFAQGTKMLAGTLFEEHIHLQEHLEDCTRSMPMLRARKLCSK